MITRLSLLLALSLSACLPAPALEPLPSPVESLPACLLGSWSDVARLAVNEAQHIATGAVAPLEQDIRAMNEGDLHLIHWAVVWGIINRGLREGVIQCDAVALGWAEARFRAYGTYLQPAPTGAGHNALRRVTSGWGPLPLKEAAAMTDGDFHSALEYMGLVIDAYLDPGGPYYIGENRWIPPSLKP